MSDAASDGRSSDRILLVEDDIVDVGVLRSEHPDLLVSDIGMPGVDGYGLIQRVRALPDNVALIPAIALTAYARAEDRTKALLAGFNMHVSKPIEPAELLAAIAGVSGRRRVVRP